MSDQVKVFTEAGGRTPSPPMAIAPQQAVQEENWSNAQSEFACSHGSWLIVPSASEVLDSSEGLQEAPQHGKSS